MKKCDVCGKNAVCQCGYYVYRGGERLSYRCAVDHSLIPGGNPIFKNEVAWVWWSKKHPRLAKKLVNKGGPKYQFHLKQKG